MSDASVVPSTCTRHSSVSDGTETPAELVRAAAAAPGSARVALTDHDSTAGLGGGAAAAAEPASRLIPGMELCTRLEFASVHMLGYLFDPTDPALVAETAAHPDGRLRRAEEMVRRIAADYDITWDDVLAPDDRGRDGRPAAHRRRARRARARARPQRGVRGHPALAQRLLPAALRARPARPACG